MKAPIVASAPELPFELENQLERDIAADPEWLAGVEWGQQPRHPEGKILCHTHDVLNNIDHFFGDDDDYAPLRLLTLIIGPDIRKQSHRDWARKLAEHHCIKPGVLEVIELYGAAYEVSSLMS